MKANVVIAISGGIAAYKIPFLIRLFRKAGHKVKVVVTKNALNFVTEATLQTLSDNLVYSDMFAGNKDMTEHISIADWADYYIVAPATANIIGKYANAIADDCISTT
ncbi:MAG: flavoprotein, partial [Bacteroidales bacterium]|nr:flavoprotein [Bacteroidales bacterium]